MVRPIEKCCQLFLLNMSIFMGPENQAHMLALVGNTLVLLQNASQKSRASVLEDTKEQGEKTSN